MRVPERWAICLRKQSTAVADFKHRLWWVEWDDRGDRGGFYGGPTNNARLYRSEQDARRQAIALAVMAGESDLEVVEVSQQLIQYGCLE